MKISLKSIVPNVRRNFNFRPTRRGVPSRSPIAPMRSPIAIAAIAVIILTVIGVTACKKDPKPELALSGLTDNALTFAAAGETKTFDIASNVEWTISGKPTWLTLSHTAGKGSVKVTATAAANTAETPLTATLTVTVKGLPPANVAVTQAAAPPTLPKTVSVGEQSGTMTARTTSAVTYVVATENIANGAYTATVANRPAGVTVSGQVTIAGNAGTLTLSGNTEHRQAKPLR